MAAVSKFYENWCNFLKERNLSWPDGDVGEEIKNMFSEYTGWQFFHQYVKNSASWFGGSSSLRVKLFFMLSYMLELVPDDGSFDDIKPTIFNMYRTSTFDGRFFKKYFIRHAPEKLKDGLLDLLVDAEQRMKGKKKGPEDHQHIRIIHPPHFLAFITFMVKKEAKQKLTDEQYVLFCIMEDMDIKDGSTFADLDYCLEAVSLYIHMAKVDIILEGKKLENHEKNQAMANNIVNYARTVQPMLNYHTAFIEDEKMLPLKEALLQSIIRINEVITFNMKFEDVENINTKDKQLIKYVKENIELEQMAIDKMAAEKGMEKQKVAHKIQNVYYIICTMTNSNIPINDKSLIINVYDIDPLFAFTLLFALNTGITSARDWWYFYESIVRADGILKPKIIKIAKEVEDDGDSNTPTKSSSE